MPEGLEAEIWRIGAAGLVGRRLTAAEADGRVVDERIHEVVGERVTGVRRHGKVVLLETTGPTIGLRFGMTGRLIVDGVAPIERLEYASGQDRAEWDRLRLWAEGGVEAHPAVRLNDPRGLGRVELDPDLSSLGHDILGVTSVQLGEALSGRSAAIKVTLMNQRVVAGLGNLCADEVLFAAGLDPRRPVDELTGAEIETLHRSISERLSVMLAAGGSTSGILDPGRRRRLGPCPLVDCRGVLARTRLGARTTVWCPAHQPAAPKDLDASSPDVMDASSPDAPVAD